MRNSLSCNIIVLLHNRIKKAFKEANIQVKGKDGEKESYPLLKCWQSMDAFLLIDDSIEDFIMKKVQQSSGDSQTSESQQLVNPLFYYFS